MTPGFRNIAITVLLALSAAAGGAVLCANYVASLHKPGSSLHEIVHKELVLSPDQGRRLDEVEARFAMRRKAREDELRAANRTLASAIQESRQDSPKVQAAIDHIHHNMGELQKETIAHVFEMRAILTPDQAKKFDTEVVKALTEGDR